MTFVTSRCDLDNRVIRGELSKKRQLAGGDHVYPWKMTFESRRACFVPREKVETGFSTIVLLLEALIVQDNA